METTKNETVLAYREHCSLKYEKSLNFTLVFSVLIIIK